MYILINGVDVTDDYSAKSLRIVSRTGSDRTTFSFKLDDPSVEPAEEQEVVVYDSDLMRIRYGRGRVKRVKKTVAAPTREDPTIVVFTYELEIGGWMRDVERRPAISETYFDKTTGFMFRDVAGQVPNFDISAISTGGSVISIFELQQEPLMRALDRIAALENKVWWVDFDKKFHLEAAGETMAPFEVTDDTWQELAGFSLSVEPDSDNVANSLRMFYRGKYTEGQVNVFATSNEVTGVGTNWTDHVFPGSKFRLHEVSNIAYTVQEVRSDTLIILSSPYNEATSVTPVDYVIEDIPRATLMENYASMEALALITGDDGKFAAIVEPPSGFLTYQEARDYLYGILQQRANPTVNINFKSTNRQIPGIIEAGQSVIFQLTQWNVDTVLQIRQLTLKDVGGGDTDGYPVFEYDFKFEAKLFDLASRFRKKDEADALRSRDASGLIEEILGAGDVIRFTEVSGLLTTLSEGGIENVPVTEVVTKSADFEGPFVWAPATGLNNPARWSRCWWASMVLVTEDGLDTLVTEDGDRLILT